VSITLRSLIRELQTSLAAHGVDAPRLSAQVLAAHVVGCSRMDVLLDPGRELSASKVETVRTLARRLAAGEPLAYVTGVREFYGLDFSVGPGVLIPRPETETMVEEARRVFTPDAELAFADLGSGSGALGVALAAVFPRARGVLVDQEPRAARASLENALRNGVDSRVLVVQADFMTQLFRPASLDLIVSNPPYIGEAELADVQPQVLAWEPRQALIAGPTGLEVYPELAARAMDALRSGGRLLLETGWTQAQEVGRILRAAGYLEIRIGRDLAGHERTVMAMKRPNGLHGKRVT